MNHAAIYRERLATLKDHRRIAVESLDKVLSQIDRTGMNAMLRRWRADPHQPDHVDARSTRYHIMV